MEHPAASVNQGGSPLDSHLTETLQKLSSMYENADFIKGDPSWFMHQYTEPAEQERVAFLAAALSYGSRKQFLPKIQQILDLSPNLHFETSQTPPLAFANGQNAKGSNYSFIQDNDECFYRLHTNRMVKKFLEVTDGIYAEYGSILGLMEVMDVHTALDAVKVITGYFALRDASDLIPKDAKSSCKRICMFLRWMVRDDSPVDLGLWSKQIDKSTLIMPMDTHVLQEAQKLGLIKSKTSSMATAIKLTNKLKEYFPEDPTKADFALFGLGVNQV